MSRRVALVALVMAAACDRGSTDSSVASGGVASAGSANAPSAPSPSRSVGRAELDEGAVRQLVDAWVAAQNRGDFEAYERTYATKFYGVKRVGGRAKRYDRAGWLEDRKALFEKGARVTVDGVRVVIAGGSAVVHLRQTWSTKTFSDEGPKQLVVALEGGPKIAREEMLHSTVGDANAAPEAPPPEELAFVKPGAGGVMLLTIERVLESRREALLAHVQDHPRLAAPETNPWAARATRPLLANGVLEKHRALLGQTMDLYGASGRTCRAQVESFVVIADVVPHFGTILEWRGQSRSDPRDSVGPVTPPAVRAMDTWNMAIRTGGVFIAAELSPIDGDCADSVFARRTDLSTPVHWNVLQRELDEAGRRIVHAWKPWRSLQGAYGRATSKTSPWFEQDQQTLEVHALEPPGNGHSFLSISIAAGNPCGGEFFGELWALIENAPGGPVIVSAEDAALVDAPRTYPALIVPAFVYDLENDGRPEIISNERLLRSVRGRWQVVLDAGPVYLGCPC